MQLDEVLNVVEDLAVATSRTIHLLTNCRHVPKDRCVRKRCTAAAAADDYTSEQLHISLQLLPAGHIVIQQRRIYRVVENSEPLSSCDNCVNIDQFSKTLTDAFSNKFAIK